MSTFSNKNPKNNFIEIETWAGKTQKFPIPWILIPNSMNPNFKYQIVENPCDSINNKKAPTMEINGKKLWSK